MKKQLLQFYVTLSFLSMALLAAAQEPSLNVTFTYISCDSIQTIFSASNFEDSINVYGTFGETSSGLIGHIDFPEDTIVVNHRYGSNGTFNLKSYGIDRFDNLLDTVNTSIAVSCSVEIDANFYSLCDSAFCGISFDEYEPGMTMETYWGDGTSITSSIYLADIARGWAEHFYETSGTYTAVAILYDPDGNPLDTAEHTFNIACSYLSGMVYFRNDEDCTYDFDEDGIASIPVTLKIYKDDVLIDEIPAYGGFSYFIESPDYDATYKIELADFPAFYSVGCPSTSFYNFTLDEGTAYAGNFDFGLDCSGSGKDLSVLMSGCLRSVDTSYLYVAAQNINCATEIGAEVTLQISPKYTYLYAYPVPGSVSGSTIAWNADIDAGATTDYIVFLGATAAAVPGDTACHLVSIGPVTGDIDISNNSYTFCDSIRSSYDPNDKKVSPMGAIEPGTLLTYTINFENKGNDTAFNIHILDELSSFLDVTSFQLLYSSHAVNTSIQSVGDNKLLRFEFNDIELPDASSPSFNKGFVIFSIKAKAGLPWSTEILNTASIFFDINPAILTNTVANFIPDPSDVDDLSSKDGIMIFPNPTENVINIIDEKGICSKIILINNLGQNVFEADVKKGNNIVSIERLPAGIYYLTFPGNDNVIKNKIIKR